MAKRHEVAQKWAHENPVHNWHLRVRWFEKHFDDMTPKRQKFRCRMLLSKAIAYGIIARPTCCMHCYERVEVFGHHEDYRAVLDVVWLCRKCHNEADRLREQALGIVRKIRGYVYVPASAHEEALRLWKKGGMSQVRIGRLLGISNSTVSKIVRGLTRPREKTGVIV